MKKMKKLLALSLAIMLLLATSACASTPTASNGTASPSSGNQSEPAAPETPAVFPWPTGDVTMYVASSAGGGTDTQARIFAEYFKKHTGCNMIVENQSSGSGTVAYELVRTAEADGNTLLFYHSSMFIAYYSGLYEYGILEHFTPLAKITTSLPNALCVPIDSPYNSVDELVAAAKAAPETIVAGIQVGGFPEYLIKLLEKDGNCSFKRVDAGNANDRLTSLLGGHIDVACISAGTAVKNEQAGKLKVLAVCSDRIDGYDWASIIELGYPNVSIPNEHYLYSPAGLSEEQVKAMNEVLYAIGQDPEFIAAIKENDAIPSITDYDTTIKDWKAADQAVKALFESM